VQEYEDYFMMGENQKALGVLRRNIYKGLSLYSLFLEIEIGLEIFKVENKEKPPFFRSTNILKSKISTNHLTKMMGKETFLLQNIIKWTDI
jgi:hypothetical protein